MLSCGKSICGAFAARFEQCGWFCWNQHWARTQAVTSPQRSNATREFVLG